MRVIAAVSREKAKPFSIEELDLESPRPDEVLVRIASVGVCHTDVKVRDGARPVPRPIVLGHEGAGIVEAVGSEVREVRPGDHVVLSFDYCGTCTNCRSGRQAYCEEVFQYSFGGARPDGSSPLRKNGEVVHGMFFGQSSFANYALASRRNVVKVPKEAPLEILGPLGCGVQTGAGAVLNSLAAEASSSIAVFGAGSVGLSAVMAASVVGCSPIIAIDISAGRLELARQLGATHTFNGAEVPGLVEAIRDVTGGGVDYSLDTTSNPAVFRQAVDSLKMLGTCGLIGGMAPGTEVCIEANHLLPGRSVRGIIQGDSVPQKLIPKLIDLYMDGRFPFDRLIRLYALEEINQACADMAAGSTIKPVLRVA